MMMMMMTTITTNQNPRRLEFLSALQYERDELHCLVIFRSFLTQIFAMRNKRLLFSRAWRRVVW
jgi:hypothetical protein